MPVWGLLIPSLWFWLLVLALIVIYIYSLKKILEAEEESYVTPIIKERLKWEVTKMKYFEIIAWIFLAVGVIIYAYGILNLSPLVIFGAGCLLVGSYLVATYYRKRRFKHQKELEKKLL